MENRKPDIFLCHNRADKPWVQELGARLEAESIDGTKTGRSIRVFMDEWDIEKGENLVSRLGEELDSGAFVAVVMSPEFFASDWTRFEWTDVVARDPANRRGRLLPMRRRDVSLDGSRRVTFPAPFNALSYFDFRSESHFEAEFESLLRRVRNMPPQRGRNVQPRYSSSKSPAGTGPSRSKDAAAIEEILVSNLAPVIDTPPPIFFAKTALKSLSDLPSESSLEDVTLRLWEGNLSTFADLEDPECTLNAHIDPFSIQRKEFKDCLTDLNQLNLWVSLANKSLERVLRKRGIAQDEKKRFYFLPGPDQANRVISVRGQRSREVAAKKQHHVTGEDFWVHYCANMRFRVIASSPFLRVLPSYSFTHDGVEPLSTKQAGRYRIVWGGKQDSATVLRQILFWQSFVSNGHEEWELETGGNPIRLSVMPATAATRVGIAADHVSIRALVEDAPEDELASVADSADLIEESDEEADKLHDEDHRGEQQ